jgi:hypothetical protein
MDPLPGVLTAAEILQVRDGKIVRGELIYDAEQLGGRCQPPGPDEPPLAELDSIRVSCIVRSLGVPSRLVARAGMSDGFGQFGEHDCESTAGWLVGGDLVMPSAQVLDERVPGGQDPQIG